MPTRKIAGTLFQYSCCEYQKIKVKYRILHYMSLKLASFQYSDSIKMHYTEQISIKINCWENRLLCSPISIFINLSDKFINYLDVFFLRRSENIMMEPAITIPPPIVKARSPAPPVCGRLNCSDTLLISISNTPTLPA